MWRITDEGEISALLNMVFEEQNAVVKKTLENPKKKLLLKLRNALIVKSRKRIDLIDAERIIDEWMNKLREKKA